MKKLQQVSRFHDISKTLVQIQTNDLNGINMEIYENWSDILLINEDRITVLYVLDSKTVLQRDP